MKKAVFSIDGGNTDFTFVGYSSNMYWNGWSVPYFSETTIKKLFEQECMFQDKDSESILSFEGGVLYETYNGDKVVISSGVYFDVNGEKYYAFDCGWCWVEVTSLGQLAELCESFDNANGEWDNVREDEREYLIETIEFHSLNK